MGKYVDLEAAQYRLEKLASIQDNPGRAKGMRAAAKELETMVVDGVEYVRHGQWVTSPISCEQFRCSVCGGAAWHYDRGWTVTKSKYCPNCGAKMMDLKESAKCDC